MKYPYSKLLQTVFLLFCINFNLTAQWSSANMPSPGGGYISSLYINGEHFFAAGGSDQGAFVSSNRGENWQAIGLNLPLLEIEKFALCDSNIIAASSRGLYVSSINNYHWNRVDSNLDDWGLFDVVADKNYALAIGSEQGIYKSFDNGLSWEKIESEYFSDGSNALAMQDSIVFVSNKSGLYKSLNYGDTWIRNDTGVVFKYINKLEILDSIVCASSFNYGIYISYNLGNTWEHIDSTIIKTGTIRIALSDTNLYLGTCENKIISYSYKTKQFITLKEDFPFKCITTMVVSDSNIFIGTSGNGIFSSKDNGKTWDEKNKGLTAIEINAFAYKDNLIFAGSANYGLFTSNDHGVSWSKANNGIVTNYIYSLITKDNNVFAGTYDGIYVSENNGISWELIHSLSAHDFEIIENTLFAGGNDGLVLTTDNGKSWRNSPLFFLQNITALTSIEDTLFVGTSLNGVIAVKGSSWFERKNELNPNAKSVRSFETIGNTLYVVTWSGTYYSKNNGITWEEMNLEQFGGNIQASLNIGENIFVGSKKGIYQSKDYGSTWSTVNNGLSDLDVRALFNNDKNIFAATGYGVWRRSVSELITSVSEQKYQKTNIFSLEQNYPNPFNPTTIISYSIPQNAFVSITIYDLLGSVVKTLVNESKSAGSYNINFNASGISSGIYYYTIKANDFIETKKLVLIK